MTDTTMTPGAAQAIAHHNHEADQAHRRAMQALGDYNRAMARLQAAMVAPFARWPLPSALKAR